jgi:hypothetical protein
MAQLQREEEEREFEQNAQVLPDGRVLTGYGGLASIEDSDGTVYETPDAGPSPDRLERDRVRAHELRNRVRYQRLLKAERRLVAGCLGQRLRMPQARRPRPAVRRRTANTRAGPRSSDPDLDDEGSPLPREGVAA